ncbi:hypothetical protein [Rhodococcus sp. P1Y]|uniref:hypothetical protein n=1 Tax=Rhodococcus sp. P1Y TaxID=1302308 RepID=UPI000EAF9F28|nr:hypothetical protein [Rhodococcus sp. P1Y]AYJ48130.1 hypothetical protein D8W71_07030 [Rhodococcus sp. P1Y]
MSSPIDDLLHHCRSLGLTADVGTMFRSPALRCEGKVFAFVGHNDTLIVKLPHDRIAELDADGLGHQVTMGERTMREWAEVPAGPAPELWNDLTVEAYRFVSSLVS